MKILVHEEGLEVIRERVEAGLPRQQGADAAGEPGAVAEIEASFAPPPSRGRVPLPLVASVGLRAWINTNVAAHKLARLRRS